MGDTLTFKILRGHLVSGRLAAGEEIAVRIDQTLTQDATGTMAYLQFEAMGIPRVRTKLSVSYVDHNTLQTGFENADDHAYLQSVAAKHGALYSRPGNGICHQLHLERFAVPGATLLGSDSHTPTAGGAGCLGIGAGGLDVAVAMAGGAFHLTAPRVVRVNLAGALTPGVSAKDVILEVLRRLTVKGGVGAVIEYGGPGVASLSVPERGTITNMGAELGATSSIFPSDSVTKAFLEAQGRGGDWVELLPDTDATYDDTLAIDLSELQPLAAQPHSPDAVAPIAALCGLKVDQCCIGSCTNSSLLDMLKVAAILKGKQVHPTVSLTISPGSRQVLEMLARSGALADMISAGARVLETTCGPCIGLGQSPRSGAVTLRTFNRNFEGRSGTADAKAYLVSPEVAAASALTGVITDPREGGVPQVELPSSFAIDDRMVLPPAHESCAQDVEVRRGPNIKPFPLGEPLPSSLAGTCLAKVGDNITTDDIMPAGSKVLHLRSNIPAISRHVFANVDPDFADKALAAKGAGIDGFVVGGHNYGQGSSREHAALAPMYLGVKAVVAKSFARIHKANLVNFGILPLTFASESDYDGIDAGDALDLPAVRAKLLEASGKPVAEPFVVAAVNTSKGGGYALLCDLSPRELEIVLAGGLLRLTASAQA